MLGILTMNIWGFAAAPSLNYSPDLPSPGSLADRALWFANLLLFEGKMRALFSILFGASLLLFIERMEAAERDGMGLQLRRLGWLAGFGLLHYYLLWQGDILFLYAAVGLVALSFRRAPPLALVATALFAFTLWQGFNWFQWQPAVAAESAVAAGAATPAQTKQHEAALAHYQAEDREHVQVLRQGWSAVVGHTVREEAARPLIMVLFVSSETLTYILFGMALFKSGFFVGEWPRRQLLGLALGGIALGGLATGAFALWANAAQFQPSAMRFALNYGLSFPHLAMGLGYAAVLMLLAPRLLRSALGVRLVAAGRMAFSNYIATSAVMTGLFYGWGLGLIGRYGPATLWLFVLLGWALMLGWSKPWLARFRQGPLEWLWRSLTEGRKLPLRR